MATQRSQTGLNQTIKFNWILNPSKDLLFYIGSALLGWLYIGIILYFLNTKNLTNPLTDTLFVFLGIPITLSILVVASWGILLDAPHLFATLARTIFDPDEWQMRGSEIKKSFGFFFLGPLLISVPYFLGNFISIPTQLLGLGAVGFFIFFRLWAYYHVVRQHWGFFSLYKRKSGDYSYHRIDYWFFQLTLYLPLLIFMTSSYYLVTPGFPDIGLHSPLVNGISIAQIINPIAWSIYIGIIVLFIFKQVQLYRSGETLNGSKLLYMVLIVPLHFVAFSNPILVLFLVPIVTVGHNVQYHLIVIEYGKKKYVKETDSDAYSIPRMIFKNIWVYALLGFVFTLLFYRGPIIELVQGFAGSELNVFVFNSIGMMAGIKNPTSLDLGTQVFSAFLLGWAMQHYYLDSKIWRVSKDKKLRENLDVD